MWGEGLETVEESPAKMKKSRLTSTPGAQAVERNFIHPRQDVREGGREGVREGERALAWNFIEEGNLAPVIKVSCSQVGHQGLGAPDVLSI